MKTFYLLEDIYELIDEIELSVMKRLGIKQLDENTRIFTEKEIHMIEEFLIKLLSSKQ